MLILSIEIWLLFGLIIAFLELYFGTGRKELEDFQNGFKSLCAIIILMLLWPFFIPFIFKEKKLLLKLNQLLLKDIL